MEYIYVFFQTIHTQTISSFLEEHFAHYNGKEKYIGVFGIKAFCVSNVVTKTQNLFCYWLQYP